MRARIASRQSNGEINFCMRHASQQVSAAAGCHSGAQPLICILRHDIALVMT
jgi:hypothetical protein